MRKNISRRTFIAGSVRLAVATQLIQLEPPEAAARVAQRLPASDRRTLRAAIDVLIPADGRMPAASAVGGIGYVERLAGQDSKLRELLIEGLRGLDGRAREVAGARFAEASVDRQTAVLIAIEQAASPVGFVAALRDAVYESYYTHPRILKLLGVTFRSSRRRTAALEPFDEQRLTRVRQMPPLYREAPNER